MKKTKIFKSLTVILTTLILLCSTALNVYAYETKESAVAYGVSVKCRQVMGAAGLYSTWYYDDNSYVYCTDYFMLFVPNERYDYYCAFSNFASNGPQGSNSVSYIETEYFITDDICYETGVLYSECDCYGDTYSSVEVVFSLCNH